MCRKKGQSAIEYLMTYGWMLLVVAIAGGAIFSIAGDQSLESSSGFGDQWLIENFGYSDEENSLNLVLQNREPEFANLTEITVRDGEKTFNFDTEYTEFSSLSSEVVNIPGVQAERGSNTLDLELGYNSGSFTNMESAGTISGGYALMDEREFTLETLEQWDEGTQEGLDLFSLPITLNYEGSEKVAESKAIGQGAIDVDVDTDENIFIAGRDEPTITKYDDNGNKEWESSAEIHPENSIHDIKSDNNGDVYVALGSWPYEESVVKIDGDTGDRLWENTNPRYVYGGLRIDNDNEIIYAADRNERVFLIDFQGNEITRISTSHDERLRSVTYDNQGDIYTGSRDNTIRKHDDSGNELWSYTNPSGDIWDLVVDSDYIYSVSSDNTVRKNDRETGELEASYDMGSTGHTISQTDTNIFVGMSSNKVEKLDKNLENEVNFQDHPSTVRGTAIRNEKIYSVSTALYVTEADGSDQNHVGDHESRIREVTSDDAGNSYTASRDGKVRKFSSNAELQWETDTGNRVRAIEIGENQELYAGNRDGDVYQLDTNDGSITTQIDAENSVWGVDADKEDYIYAGTYSEGIFKFDATGDQQWQIDISDPVRGIEVIENGLIASTGDGNVKKIDQDGDIEWENNDHSREVWDVTSNGNIVYTASADNTMKGLDLENGEELWTQSGPGGSISDIGSDDEGNIYVSAGGNTKKFDQFGRVVWESSEGSSSNYVGEDTIATMSWPDGVVKLDKETGETIWEHSTHSGSTMWGLTTDENSNIYTASADNTILKSTPEGLQDWRFEGHSGTVFDVEYDHSEDALFSISRDNTVRKIDDSGTQLWSTNPAGSSGYTIGMGEDNIYTGHNNGNVYEISKSNGEVLNSFNIHDSRVWRLNVDSEHIYSGGLDDKYRKTEISTGDEVLNYDSPDDRVAATHDPTSSNAFIATYEGEVRKIDESGNTEWVFDEYDENRRVYDVIANEDQVFAVSNDGTLRALNKADGSEEWQYNRWRDRTATSVHVDSEDNAYLGDTYGNFYKFDPEGELVTTSSGLTTRTQGVVMDEDEHVYAVGRGSRFTKHNNETGAQEWESPHVRTSIWNSPLDYRDGNLYITRADGSTDLGVVDPEDGSLIETIDTSSSNRAVDVASDGRIMMGVSGGTQLLDSDGEEVWECSSCHDRYSYEVEWGPDEDIVYSIGTFDGKVIAQDPSNGDIIWEWENSVHNRQQGLNVGEEGLVYAGGYDRIVNVLNGATGEEEFTIQGHSGTIYSLDTDSLGNVYSVSSDNTILASSAEGQSLWSRTDPSRTVLGVSVNSENDVFFGGLDLKLRKLTQEFSEKGEYNSTIFDAGAPMNWPKIETETISNDHRINLTAEFSEDLDFTSGVETTELTELDGEETHELNIENKEYGRINLQMGIEGADTGNSPAVSNIMLRSELEEEE